ncbi:zonadhesin-like isoform X1 [Clavelina lepadiformis]|uniref:zonadhesin-like isoform X1 n=1 Tax=Clavelina lepadiformis TaxID=159417 RepID=UPI004041E585
MNNKLGIVTTIFLVLSCSPPALAQLDLTGITDLFDNLDLSFLTDIFDLSVLQNLDLTDPTNLILLTSLGGRRPAPQPQCPGNQVFSVCASCIVTCEERFNPQPCRDVCTPQCTCRAGLYWDGRNCVDDSECPAARCNCGRFETCSRTGIVPTCRCIPGYVRQRGVCLRLQPRPLPCRCGANARCLRREDGSPYCECLENYIGDGITCIADPCNRCSAFASCSRANEVSVCVCNSGYEGNGENCAPITTTPAPTRPTCPGNQVYSVCASCVVACEDRFNPPACPLLCSARCTCRAGTYWDGNNCVQSSLCPGDQPRIVSSPIQTNPCDRCSEYASCAEANGVSLCVCNIGYTGDGETCNAFVPATIAYATAAPAPVGCAPTCSEFGRCVQNEDGIYRCACLFGYTGTDCSIPSGQSFDGRCGGCGQNQICILVGSRFRCVNAV